MKSSTPKSLGAFAAVLACAVALLGIGASAASAAPEAGPGWNYKLTFGEEGNGHYFDDTPRNQIALDSTGNIFAVQFFNPGNAAIYKPDPVAGGEFLTRAGTFPTLNIAIDQSNNALYTDETRSSLFPPFPQIIKRWTSDGQPTPTYTLDPTFEVPQGDGFAVDPTTHDVLVTAPGAEGVRRYDTTGTLIETIATPSISPSWILTMADGSFLVASASGPDVTHFSGSGTALGTIANVGTLSGLSYDPVRDLIVASVGDQLKNYSPAGTLMGTSPSHGGGADTVVAPSGVLYEENESGTINVYTAGFQPGVEEPVVSEIAGHSAHVEAEVDPGEEGPGEAPAGTKAHFEYSADGGHTWNSTPDQELTDSDLVSIEADLTGLLPNLGYLVRVVAANSSGNSSTSVAADFSTSKISPEVETAAASGLGETSATLNGVVNPNGLQTTYHFEYGTSTSYGSRVPVVTEGVAGDQRTSRSFSKSVTGLVPGTTYHYRIVAANSVGEIAGVDRSFTTAGEAAPDRAYELVTPVDKRGAQVANDLAFQAALGGSAIAVNVSAGPSDGESALMRQSYVLWRGAASWSDWVNADAPVSAKEGLYEASTAAISGDFTQALVVSNRDLAPGGIADGGNLYVKDLRTGDYTFVGGAAGRQAYQDLAGVNVHYSVFAAAAPDFSWILLWSFSPLLPEVEGSALYRWTPDEGLKVESRLPDGTVPPSPVSVPTPEKLETPIASADGSLVGFDLNRLGGGGVYIRENGQSTAISVSHRTGDDPSEVHPGTLDWVTPNGRYVFFHSPDSVPLTEDTPAAHGPENIYRYNIETEELTYIGETAAGQGTLGVFAAGEDGQTVFFYDSLNSVAWHSGDIDVLSSIRLQGSGYATDNGRYFGWVGSEGDAHLYDTQAGESICVSCPAGGTSLGGAHFQPIQRGLANRPPRAILEDGTMFFDTPNPLLPADHNGTQDVYSYKNGSLTLISPGNRNVGARFVDASEDGKDVYFQTEQGILPQDVDGSTDLYDARVGGGFSQSSPQVPCSGEGCHGPIGTAPKEPSIGSVANGTGGPGTGPAITGLRALSAADRAKLAKGKQARLKLHLSRPGAVKVVGTSSAGRVIKASVQAKQAGAVSVPIRLSKKGLKELHRKGSLAIRLTVTLGGEGQKATAFTLKAGGGKKGRSS